MDGFAAAKTLAKENPGFYNTLTNYRHPWHASGNEDVCIQPSAMAPVLNVHPDTKAVYQVRWNNYDRAPKTNWHTSEQREWYMAARAYNDLLTKSSNEIWTQLQPGTALSKRNNTSSIRILANVYDFQSSIIGECCTDAPSSLENVACVAAMVCSNLKSRPPSLCLLDANNTG